MISRRSLYRNRSQVIDHKEMSFAELSHDLCVTPIGFGSMHEVVVKLRGTDIDIMPLSIVIRMESIGVMASYIRVW